MVMDKQRAQLIKNLSQDLEVIQHPGETFSVAILWLIVNFILAMLLTLATGPFRTGSLDQLQTHPQFFIESLVGVAAICLLAFVAFRTGLPTGRSMLRISLAPILLLLAWIIFYFIGFWEPALPASMAGKREIHCNLTTLLIGLPSLLFGLVIIRRLWPLHGAWSGLLMGFAAGATPALIMQFACMYSIEHIFQHHLLPGLLLGPIGMVMGKYMLKK